MTDDEMNWQSGVVRDQHRAPFRVPAPRRRQDFIKQERFPKQRDPGLSVLSDVSAAAAMRSTSSCCTATPKLIKTARGVINADQTQQRGEPPIDGPVGRSIIGDYGLK